MFTFENKISSTTLDLVNTDDFNGQRLEIGDRVFGVVEFEDEEEDCGIYQGWITDFWLDSDSTIVASLSSTPDLQNVCHHEVASRLVLLKSARK